MSSKEPKLRSNPYFDAYLAYHNISLVSVARLAGIRLTSVWRVQHDLPVHFPVAAALRSALFKYTGIPYIAPISTEPESESQNTHLKEEQPVDEQDTYHLRASRLLDHDRPAKRRP